jgi:hypothetical protein
VADSLDEAKAAFLGIDLRPERYPGEEFEAGRRGSGSVRFPS